MITLPSAGARRPQHAADRPQSLHLREGTRLAPPPPRPPATWQRMHAAVPAAAPRASVVTTPAAALRVTCCACCVLCAGDSATEEAHYITKYARHVHLLVRGPEMRASKTMRDRVLQHSGITVHYNTAVADAFGDGDGLQGLRLVDTVDGSKRDLALRGLFYGIGHNPNSGLVSGQVCGAPADSAVLVLTPRTYLHNCDLSLTLRLFLARQFPSDSLFPRCDHAFEIGAKPFARNSGSICSVEF